MSYLARARPFASSQCAPQWVRSRALTSAPRVPCRSWPRRLRAASGPTPRVSSGSGAPARSSTQSVPGGACACHVIGWHGRWTAVTGTGRACLGRACVRLGRAIARRVSCNAALATFGSPVLRQSGSPRLTPQTGSGSPGGVLPQQLRRSVALLGWGCS
jgi:hypothetical protein